MVRTFLLLAAIVGVPARAQPLSTHCQTEEVRAVTQTIELRLVGCGDGFASNTLWHLDRADSLSGALDGHVTRTLTGKGAVVYMFESGVMRDHDEFARADGSVVIGSIDLCSTCGDRALMPVFNSEFELTVDGHGTGTGSMVAGRNTGIAPDAKLVSVYAAVGSDIRQWVSLLDLVIRHAWDPATPSFKTAIINMSFVPNKASAMDPKFPLFEKKMREMILGVDREGNPDSSGKRFLFVTIAGNHAEGLGDQCDVNSGSDIYPAVLGPAIDGLITVGGIDETNRLWEGSCRGPFVEVLAPAANVLVASISASDHYRSAKWMLGLYPANYGTSFAAPYVAGLAALLLEKDPDLTPTQLEAIIKSTSSRVANVEETTAGGRVATFDMTPTGPKRRIVRRGN